MKNSLPEKKILCIISNSAGEIDWVLPVLHHLFSQEKESHVTVHFNSFWPEHITKQNSKLLQQVHEYADVVLSKSDFVHGSLRTPLKWIKKIASISNVTRLGWLKLVAMLETRYFQNRSEQLAQLIFDKTEPKVFLKDLSGDSGLRAALSNKVRSAGGKVILFPHGSEIFVEERPKVQANYIADLLLCATKFTEEKYKTVFPGINTSIVGVPRYDNHWIDLQRSQKIKAQTGHKKFNILFITRGPHATDLSEASFEYLMDSVVEVVAGFPNAHLLVRPHPRYGERLLRKYLRKNPRLSWSFEYTSVFGLATELNLVISMWSTMILDVLAVGLPVIEFFRFEGSTHKWSISEKGEPITCYQDYSLAVSTKDKLELKELISQVHAGNIDLFQVPVVNFKKYLPNSDKTAVSKVAELLTDNKN